MQWPSLLTANSQYTAANFIVTAIQIPGHSSDDQLDLVHHCIPSCTSRAWSAMILEKADIPWSCHRDINDPHRVLGLSVAEPIETLGDDSKRWLGQPASNYHHPTVVLAAGSLQHGVGAGSAFTERPRRRSVFTSSTRCSWSRHESMLGSAWYGGGVLKDASY